MYSMKELAEKDLFSLFEKISKQGYQAIELVGYYMYTPKQIREELKRHKLEVPSVHVPIRLYDKSYLEKDFEKSAQFIEEVGAHYMVIPWIPISEKLKQVEIDYLENIIGEFGRIAKKHSLQLVLHNYSREFKRYEDGFVIDEILSKFKEDELQLELDFGALYIAGLDPFEIYRKYEQRTPLIHLRDITYFRKDCLLGEGLIDYKEHLYKMPQLDNKILYIEQQFDKQHELENTMLNFAFVKAQLEKISSVPQ